jgi:L-iditol 2-dehydrogenase
MKVAVLKSNAEIVVEEQADPIPTEDECLIDVAAVGVCSSDIARAHSHGAYFYPLVMGHELAGIVIKVGNEVKDFCVGDRVTVYPLLPCFTCEACAYCRFEQCHNYKYYGSRNNGGFAQRISVKAWNLLRVPDNVNLNDAALTEPTAVVIHAIKKMLGDNLPKEGAKLAIIGCGFLGLLAVDILRVLYPSLQITIIDGNSYKLEFALAGGVTALVLGSKEQWKEAMPGLVNRFDYVLEASGTPDGFGRAVAIAARAARVCWMGNISGDLVIPQVEVSSILRRELTLLGTWNSSYKTKNTSDWIFGLDLMSKGVVKPTRLVSHELTLDGLGNALRVFNDRQLRREVRYIKALVKN